MGDVFRPCTFDARWRTATVTGIAQSLYESKDFSAMPILADALEDTGCAAKEILEHCRAGNRHYRGCWVIDLLLAKAPSG